MVLMLPAGPLPAAPPDAADVRIAVRVDARPFIWRDAVSGEYLGFFWDICTEGVQRAGYSFSETEVDAPARARFLNAGTGGFDLLCDPTTITLKRVENFAAGGAAELEFSPIIFVANASYVRNVQNRRLLGTEVEDPPECGRLIDRPVGASAAPQVREAQAEGPQEDERTWIERLERRFSFTLRPQEKKDPPAQRKFEVWGYVEGTTSADALGKYILPGDRPYPLPDGQPYPTVVCTRSFPSHSQAAAAFCNGNVDRYYGDLDIARAAIADHRTKDGSRCDVEAFSPEADISYEPYAFVVSSRLPEFPERFAVALYGMFGDGTIERLFSGHFADTPKSPYLSMLFRLNSIPAGAGNPTGSGAGNGPGVEGRAPETDP